jgi:prepilin-type N-terminal cleavage/methylation domain-containing protein
MKLPRDQGFALIEVLVAMTIMALVGLMAWRGMDALIMGRDVIDRRANQDAVYTQLVNQFERDCQFILRAEVLGTNPLSAGAKNIWWIRQLQVDNRDAWMIVGYGVTPAGLQRWTSAPLLRRSEAVTLWAGVSRDPDLLSSSFRVSLTLPDVIRQTIFVRTALASGTSAMPPAPPTPTTPPSSEVNASANADSTANNASALGPTGTPAITPTTTSSGTSNAAPNAPLTLAAVTPDHRGVVMQWWLSSSSLPITRSCLMGGGL